MYSRGGSPTLTYLARIGVDIVDVALVLLTTEFGTTTIESSSLFRASSSHLVAWLNVLWF